jgi:hypothetical protein
VQQVERYVGLADPTRKAVLLGRAGCPAFVDWEAGLVHELLEANVSKSLGSQASYCTLSFR